VTAENTHPHDQAHDPEDVLADDLDDTAEESAEQLDESFDEVLNEVSEEVSEEVSDEVEELLVQLQQAESRAAEYLDSLQRERAAFQNYKRRVERERDEQRQAIAGGVLVKLLPALDDFHRAMDAVPDDERNDWFQGMALIQRKLERFLEDEGVTEMNALGEPFDPNFHEAVGVDSDSDAESGMVTEVLQRGYLHKDRVLRPAMVRVAE